MAAGRGRDSKRQEGHRAGVESITRCIPPIVKLGIEHCTLFVFSTENWKRPYDEIQFLFNLVIDYTRKHKRELLDNGIQVIPVGRWRSMPMPVVQSLSEVIRETKAGTRLKLYLAINYGGRQEIIDASLKLAEQLVKRDKHDIPKELSEGDFADLLYTKGVLTLISLFGLRAKNGCPTSFYGKGRIQNWCSPMYCGRILGLLTFTKPLLSIPHANAGSGM